MSGISNDSALDADFRAKLRELLTKTLDGTTLVETHEERPNNWGTHAAASRAAVAAYLGDTAELDRTAKVFHGWLGNRDAYVGFSYGRLSWQCHPDAPVGINEKGCMRDGHSIDGALPDEIRRGGDFQWPPAVSRMDRANALLGALWQCPNRIQLTASLHKFNGMPARPIVPNTLEFTRIRRSGERRWLRDCHPSPSFTALY